VHMPPKRQTAEVPSFHWRTATVVKIRK
jgi:hypothetical protein